MHNDYIMRIIEQVVQAILSIIRNRQSGKHEEARAEICTTLRYLVGLETDLLPLLSYQHILEYFKGSSAQLDVEKCILGADLIYEQALLEETNKQSAYALRFKMISLYLYTVALPKKSRFQTPEYFAKVSTLLTDLQAFSLPEDVQQSVFGFQNFLHSMR